MRVEVTMEHTNKLPDDLMLELESVLSKPLNNQLLGFKLSGHRTASESLIIEGDKEQKKYEEKILHETWVSANY